MIARALLRFLARTPLSTLMALLGVTLGVTSIVSVHLVSANIADRLDELIPSQLAGYTHFLHRPEVTADEYFELRRSWRRGEIGGVTGLSPLIDEAVVIAGREVRLLGIDLLQGELGTLQVNSLDGDDSFRWDGVWVEESLADVLELPVNGTIFAPAGTVVADIGVVQDLLGWSAARLSYVGVKLAAPWQWLEDLGEALLPGLGAGLPDHAGALDAAPGWRLVSLAEQHPASQFGKSVLFNISALGALALLVAWFLMYQVAVSWLRRLWPVFERLHVLGVTWRELGLYFGLAMSGLGVLAGILGIAAGYALADVLYSAALPTENTPLSLDLWVFCKAFGSSVGVCLCGGLIALNRAEERSDSAVRKRARWLILTLLIGLALGGVASEASGLLGGFAAIAILSVLAALVVVPMLSSLRAHGGWLGGPLLVRLSLRELLWYPREFSIALAGLTLAVATAIGVGLMVDSFRADFSRMLDRRLTYDLVVETQSHTLEQLEQRLAQDGRVTRLQAYDATALRIDGAPVDLTVTRMDEFESARYGLGRALGAAEVLLSEQGARSLAVDVGDTVTVLDRKLTVAGVFSSFGDLQPRLIVDLDSGLAATAGARTRSLRFNTDAPAAMLAWLRAQAPTAEVELQRDLREVALTTFDQTFAITRVLITIALIVAGIGVYVAVTTVRLNRRSSARLMASLGVSSWEGAGMDLALGVGVGAVAVALAWPLGSAFGWILCEVINPRAFGWTVALEFSADALLTPVVWGLLAAGAAGLLRFGRREEGTHVGRA